MNASDKTIVVTGASSGTGEAAARQLAAAGANVVPVGGSRAKTERTASALGVPIRTLNLLDLSDVRRLAMELRADHDHIDVLALNAGAVVASTEMTVDGIEPNLQLNAIGPFLLMQLLADRLAGGRVVSTSSDTHVRARIDDIASLMSKGKLGWHAVYARAKLVGGILLREFGRRHSDIEVVDFHPGVIASDMGRYMGTLGKALKVLARPFLDTPEDGGRRLTYLATTDDEIDGVYFHKDKPAQGSSHLHDKALAADLWCMAQGMTAQ